MVGDMRDAVLWMILNTVSHLPDLLQRLELSSRMISHPWYAHEEIRHALFGASREHAIDRIEPPNERLADSA
jgi:hypothetical protein